MTKISNQATKLAVLLAMFIMGTAVALAQTMVNGTVFDEAGDPMIGVSVTESGKKTGVSTDIDGKFRIQVAQGAKLTFSFVGYKSQTLPATDNMEVTLVEDSNLLSEVVVVGYGVQKKSVVTAAISKVSGDDLSSTAPIRMDNALKGLASGVNVTSSSGQPGAASRVRIRGIGTINNSDPPLYCGRNAYRGRP